MRVLIVEDEIGIANFMKQGLEEEGFVVEVCQDGNAGLSTALSEHFDVIVLDWMLPGKSGIEICTAFRKHDATTPILFLTAKDTLEETIFGLQVGANDYIKKPFHFEELLQRIRVQLRPKTTASNQLTLGTIVLDLNAHRVTKNDIEIQLTQREFALLELLMRNKGSVCTRTRIIESVWDIHFEYNTGVIDVYINALRKKLNLTEEDNYIQTIRGIGYLAKEL